MTGKLIAQRSQRTAQFFTENLNGVPLEMVFIPAGSFEMGSPKNEEGSRDNERPQHSVTVPRFFMGKYPVTQKQYQAIIGKNPSRFKGEDRPVEQVNWHEAMEFCDRLSKLTGRGYRLPSEAEWEYACRAGTKTPFHFGETISPEFANYRGSTVYGNGFEGEYRQETTPVSHFRVANRFGLYDMHGNVWEWCADHWHDNYEGAPTDGSAWIEGGNSNRRVLRGGSWIYVPPFCRSAFRYDYAPVFRGSFNTGFGLSFPPPGLFSTLLFSPFALFFERAERAIKIFKSEPQRHEDTKGLLSLCLCVFVVPSNPPKC